jgi:hypothetical protein
MTDDTDPGGSNDIIATIGNKEDPTQNIDIRYLSDENAFVTSGINLHFGEREILIPSQLVIVDFQLMGAIVSAILEKLSQARDMDSTFEYAPQFNVLDKTYSLEDWGEYMKLSVVE